MLTKPIAVVGLVVGVIVAAGAGAYLAVRQNPSAPRQLVEADAESLTSGLASTEPGEPAGTAVEATEAVVDTLETAVLDDIQPPAPERETLRGEPVAAPPADPAPVQTARADLPAVEGWTRPEATEPSPETAPEPGHEFLATQVRHDSDFNDCRADLQTPARRQVCFAQIHIDIQLITGQWPVNLPQSFVVSRHIECIPARFVSWRRYSACR